MLSGLSLQKKLVLGFTSIITVLMLILTSAFYNYLSQATVNNEYALSQRTVERASSQIDELYKQMDMSALYIVKNEEIHSVLSSLYSSTSIPDYDMIRYQARARDQMKILSFSFPNIISTEIYNVKRAFYFRSGLVDDRKVVNQKLADLTWYESLVPADKQLALLPPHQDYWVSISRPVISVIRKLIFSPEEDLGLFQIDLPYWNLQNICNTNIVSGESFIAVFDKKGQLLYPYASDEAYGELVKFADPNKIFGLVTASPDTAGLYKDSSSSLIYASHLSKYTGWYVVLIERQVMLQKILATYRVFVTLAGVLILLTLFAAIFILVKRLTMPLKHLTSTIMNVGLDNLRLEIPHAGHDEIRLLNESFNAMFTNIKNSINQVYESKLRETNANLLALQAQINPHFMYNTISIISASSERAGNSDAALMCSRLSDMMRYIVAPANSMVALREEVAHAVNYLELIKGHYQDFKNPSISRLDYTIKIPDEMNHILVPKMVLQPIVENCINHGFKEVPPPWHIYIRGSIPEDGGWQINIEDNGSGFDPAVLEQIKLKLSEYRTNLNDGNLLQNLKIGGMGIMNTFARLLIHFGSSAYLDIVNTGQDGCKVSFGCGSGGEDVDSDD